MRRARSPKPPPCTDRRSGARQSSASLESELPGDGLQLEYAVGTPPAVPAEELETEGIDDDLAFRNPSILRADSRERYGSRAANAAVQSHLRFGARRAGRELLSPHRSMPDL